MGFPRLIAVHPVVALCTTLPWQLSTLHMRVITSPSFKLLMLYFETGPLATPWSISNLLRFMVVATFPIRDCQSRSDDDSNTKNFNLIVFVKVIVEGGLKLLVIIYMYSLRDRIPLDLILLLYGLHMFLFLNVLLVIQEAVADACGADLEPQFNRPYISSSLQDFSSRRLNLPVTNNLSVSVHDPILYICWMIHKQSETFLVAIMIHKNEKPPL